MKIKTLKAKKNRTDIINLILIDHRPLKDLIKIMKDTKADIGVRVVAYSKFAPLLIAHTKPEEQSLYRFMKNDEEIYGQAFEGEEEHRLADQLISEIKGAANNKEIWSAKVKVLAELVEHHLYEEEKEMLPDFKKRYVIEQREILGRRYIACKKEFEDTDNQVISTIKIRQESAIYQY